MQKVRCRSFKTALCSTKYWMFKTFQAAVKVNVNGSSSNVRIEIRAPSATDAKWLLWGMYGFHSIVSGPSEVR